MLKGNNLLKYSALFIILIIVQVTVFNKITFLNYGTPMIYIYIIIKLPIALNRNIITLIGFILGFTIDVFCNTPGINAAATTFIAFFRRPIQGLFLTVADFEEEIPQLSIQRWVFVKWVTIFVFVHHLLIIGLEAFSFFNIQDILIRAILSTILTIILIVAFEGFSINRRRR